MINPPQCVFLFPQIKKFQFQDKTKRTKKALNEGIFFFCTGDRNEETLTTENGANAYAPHLRT